jgi:hypothetical protein
VLDVIGSLLRLDLFIPFEIIPRVRLRLVESTKDVRLVNLPKSGGRIDLVDERPEREGDGEAWIERKIRRGGWRVKR